MKHKPARLGIPCSDRRCDAFFYALGELNEGKDLDGGREWRVFVSDADMKTMYDEAEAHFDAGHPPCVIDTIEEPQ